MKIVISFAMICSISVSYALAQGPSGGQEWLTSNADAQRSSWIRRDVKISKESMQKPGFQFLWKMKLESEAKQLNSLTEPVLLERLIGYRGFKSLAFVGGSSDTMYAVDYDFGRMYWTTRLNSPATSPRQNGSLACPGGLTAAATRPASLLPLPPPRGGGGNRVTSARALVGEPDKGFPDIFARGQAPALPTPPPAPPPPSPAPTPAGAGGGGGQGLVNSVYVLASDGMLHQLSVQTGKDVVMQPVRLLPPNSNASALILIDNVLYTSTSNECGGTPNGVWAIDLGNREKPVTSWRTDGPNIVGSAGPAVGTDGTIYVATDRTMVALEPRTLKLRDYFSAPTADFVTSPLVFEHRGKDLIAIASKDGRLYILNSTSVGSTDHRTPLSTTSLAAKGDEFAGALASWQDTDGTRWMLTPTSSTITAFKLVEPNGIPTFEQSWTSKEIVSPLPPIIINNVVFALSSGEYRPGGATMTAAQRAQRSKPAVLYALDATTGTELWNSGTTITSFVHSSGLSGGLGQVYVGTYDGTLYAFGFPIEK